MSDNFYLAVGLLFVWLSGYTLGYGRGADAIDPNCPALTPPVKRLLPVSALAHPCYAEDKDCVDWLKDQDPKLFCEWASGLSGAGAYYRTQGLTEDQTAGKLLSTAMKRQWTSQESFVTSYWLRWGWQVGGSLDPYQAKQAGFDHCMSKSKES